MLWDVAWATMEPEEPCDEWDYPVPVLVAYTL